MSIVWHAFVCSITCDPACAQLLKLFLPSLSFARSPVNTVQYWQPLSSAGMQCPGALTLEGAWTLKLAQARWKMVPSPPFSLMFLHSTANQNFRQAQLLLLLVLQSRGGKRSPSSYFPHEWEPVVVGRPVAGFYTWPRGRSQSLLNIKNLGLGWFHFHFLNSTFKFYVFIFSLILSFWGLHSIICFSNSSVLYLDLRADFKSGHWSSQKSLLLVFLLASAPRTWALMKGTYSLLMCQTKVHGFVLLKMKSWLFMQFPISHSTPLNYFWQMWNALCWIPTPRNLLHDWFISVCKQTHDLQCFIIMACVTLHTMTRETRPTYFWS